MQIENSPLKIPAVELHKHTSGVVVSWMKVAQALPYFL